MSRTLYTIGYEGLDIDRFIDKIKEHAIIHGIGAICDVRENPERRTKGFSRTALEFALERRGIKYYNESRFGSPFRTDIRGAEMLKLYRGYIRANMHRASVSLVETIVKKDYACCLLCYERDAMECHRSVLADYLAELNPELTVVHL